jgi:MFS family permease
VAAGGIALISSLGNLGSAASPTLAGLLTQYTGNRHYSIYLVLGMLILSALVLMVAVRPPRPGMARPCAKQRPNSTTAAGRPSGRLFHWMSPNRKPVSAKGLRHTGRFPLAHSADWSPVSG